MITIQIESNCCNAPVTTQVSDEGTGCYICSEWGKGCDRKDIADKAERQFINYYYFRKQ